MQKKTLGPELTRAINRTAQAMAAQSFTSHRAELERKALGLLKAGMDPDEVVGTIRREELLAELRPRPWPRFGVMVRPTHRAGAHVLAREQRFILG